MGEREVRVRSYVEAAVILLEKAEDLARESRESEFTSTGVECRIGQAMDALRAVCRGYA